MLTTLALGAVIGVLLGLLGGGGSILAVPALVYGAGLPLASAVPASLLVVGISSATAVLPRVRAGQVRWRIAAIFGGAGAAAAFGGAALNRLLPGRAVLLGFAALMVVAGWRMLAESGRLEGGVCALPGGGVNWRGCLPRSLGAGATVGVLTGLFGVGGGFLIIPALVVGLGLPMTTAIGTSLIIVIVNSAAGFGAHAGDASLDYGVIAAFTAAAITGSLVAARLTRYLDADRLRRWFAYLVLGVAAFVAAQAALSPAAST
ncbi:hypothetical protein BZB76_2087 [Actinomadura pelletieri DSM 43383]|uniref:Probable membrane transporter protein n=1 Tax=Actinomadura pelletieri DSM 43383 TaxID=1120940 RepID=A0A495QT84_9ACTN|nr:sulfite exporter TauE/SafE family protein [Actinomadura pelletieri]RKS76729.1 hypothetical protein BZB76_2087 [Actinomadura pelletieri DSM 43383]